MMMQDLLKKNKAAILQRWFDLILETYPANTASMMRKDKNPFTNPVGVTLSREIEVLFKNLCEGSQKEKCQASLE